MVVAADGSVKLLPVGAHDANPTQLDIPSAAIAGDAVKPGTDLYISVTVYRTGCSCYEWEIQTYFDWRGGTGLDCCNGVEDSIGTSWVGDLYLQADGWHGYYTNGLDIPEYRSDFTPNEGVGWSFKEWRYQGLGYADYGWNWAWIREPRWTSQTSNVGMKYAHTKGGSGGISLSFYNAGISVSPADSNQWSVAAYSSFSH